MTNKTLIAENENEKSEFNLYRRQEYYYQKLEEKKIGNYKIQAQNWRLRSNKQKYSKLKIDIGNNKRVIKKESIRIEYLSNTVIDLKLGKDKLNKDVQNYKHQKHKYDIEVIL